MKTQTKTSELIRQRISEIPVGEPFTPAQMLVCGTRAAVDQTLSRLVKEEIIKRVARGIFVRPKINPYVGPVNPPLMKIIEAISNGAIIQVHGAEAARRMELSTQVPMSRVFVTSGPSRTIRIGMNEVELRHIAARKVLLAGRPAGIALTAMWYLGKNEVTHRFVGNIRRKLGEEEFEALKSVLGSMPAWMRSAMLENEKMVENKRLQDRLETAGPTPTPIPATSLSPLVYLGGMAALNLPSPTGTGDWHMEQTFFIPRPSGKRSRSFISGVGCLTDTTSILGDEGIFDCTGILAELGIPHEGVSAYAANHARATADLVLDAVLRGVSPEFVTLDDWMPRDGDKEDVFFLLEEARPHLTAAQQDQLRVWEMKNAFTYKIC
jgi:hypothetical protein